MFHRVIARFWALLATAAILAGGCQPLAIPQTAPLPVTTPIAVTPNAAFKLHIGQEALIDEGNLRIRFVAVERDARCPSQVTCNEDGPALIRVTATHGDGSVTEVTLNANSPNPATALAMIESYSLRAARLEPLAETPEAPVPVQEYVATLVVRNEE